MESIQPLVSPLEISDARSALYYLSRYLKQAADFHRYSKDIFEDEERSGPTEVIRQATLSMIRFIESTEGQVAAEFDDSTYSKWAAHVTDVENSLDPDATADEIARADEFVQAMSLPRGHIR